MVAAVKALVTGGTDWISATGEDSIAMLAERLATLCTTTTRRRSRDW
jgi:hypothetical protein